MCKDMGLNILHTIYLYISKMLLSWRLCVYRNAWNCISIDTIPTGEFYCYIRMYTPNKMTKLFHKQIILHCKKISYIL